MSSVVIVGAGDFPRTEYPRYLIRSASHIVCCDSAFATWLRQAPRIFGELRLPDAVVGDMDSLSASLQKRYASIIEKVEEQDYNDQTKALRLVLARWPETDEIHIVGATGKREDHSIGNLSLLMEYPRLFGDALKATVDVVSDHGTAFALTDSCSIAVGQGRRISLFSPDNSLTLRSEGLQWKTDDVVFDNWWKATLNRATEDTVTLHFSHPSMLLVILS